jgi:membrane protein DedA with SNARE-associated domain
MMFLENVFPPIPSELIMSMAGFTAASGKLDLGLVIVAGTFGSVAGALLWYYAGRLFGMENMRFMVSKFGRLMTISPRDLEKSAAWFERHGNSMVFFGRMLPAVRTLISVPAGICRMKMAPFLFYTTLGSLIWTSLLACMGYYLQGQYALVEEYIGALSKLVIGGIVAVYLYRVITFKPHP